VKKFTNINIKRKKRLHLGNALIHGDSTSNNDLLQDIMGTSYHKTFIEETSHRFSINGESGLMLKQECLR
jgi:hypothetical protein